MTARWLAVVAILATPLSGCGGGSSETKASEDIRYIVLAETAVKSRLRNPETADFDGVFVSRKAGVPVVCGYVNGDNGFGGKSGRQRFISASVTALEEEFASGEMDAAWSLSCR